MKAIIHFRYGLPEWLELMDIPKPEPKPNELLIRVMTTTVNRTDCAMLKGSPPLKLFMGLRYPKSNTLGTDFAGIVDAIGSKVTKYKIGDKIFGFNDMGLKSHAEYICINEKSAMATIAHNMSFEQAAACIEGFHYARNIINKVKLSKDDKVLVIGGTGAIGSACVQLLKYYHTKVTAVCEGIHQEKVITLGAEKVIDYTQEDFTKKPEQYDYVFDAVGKSSFGKCKPVLKAKGIYISSELGPGNENLYLPLLTKFMSAKKVKFPFPFGVQKSLNLVKSLTEKGHFTPLIDRHYNLAQIPEAFEYVESGMKIGNVVINISTNTMEQS